MFVNFAGSEWTVFANDIVNDPLVRRERIEAPLFDLRPSILGGLQQGVGGNSCLIFAICFAGGRSEDTDCEASVAGGRVGDPIQLVVGDDVLIEPPLRPRTQNVVQLLVVVFVHPDVFAGAQPAHEAVVDAAEQLLFCVRDTDDRELREAVEVVNDAGVFELVDLVEDDDGPRTVVGRRLPVDVDGGASVRSRGEDLDVSVTTVSNHISTLEEVGVIEGYTPVVDYGEVGYDVTAILQLKVEGSALPDITDRLREQTHMVTVYETTGDHDIIAIGKFTDTDHMNDQIKELLVDPDINESNTSVVLNTVAENEQFDLEH